MLTYHFPRFSPLQGGYVLSLFTCFALLFLQKYWTVSSTIMWVGPDKQKNWLNLGTAWTILWIQKREKNPEVLKVRILNVFSIALASWVDITSNIMRWSFWMFLRNPQPQIVILWWCTFFCSFVVLFYLALCSESTDLRQSPTLHIFLMSSLMKGSLKKILV